MSLDQITAAFVTLLVIIEPIGIVPLFLALTAGFSPTERRQVAWRACLIAFAILAGSALVGDWLLRNLGITLPAFRIAGGLLLFWIAFEMVFGRRTERKSGTVTQAVEQDHIRNIAAFPMAIPLLAGPGAITATLLLAGQSDGRPLYLAALIAVIAVVMALSYVTLLTADGLNRVLGTTGNAVLSRLLGVILSALAVQFVADGVRAFVRM
jgi:multiple antibiotic resistance protein